MDYRLTWIFFLILGAFSVPAVVNATTISLGGTAVRGSGLESDVLSSVTQTFDGISLMPSDFTILGDGSFLVQGSVLDAYKAPFGDHTTYVAIDSGSVEALIQSPYVGFFWGSVDPYNTVTLTDTSGATSTFAGGENGIELNASLFVNFRSAPGTMFTTVEWSSRGPAFEIDSFATIPPSPEPPSFAIVLVGSLLLSLYFYSRRLNRA